MISTKGTDNIRELRGHNYNLAEINAPLNDQFYLGFSTLDRANFTDYGFQMSIIARKKQDCCFLWIK